MLFLRRRRLATGFFCDVLVLSPESWRHLAMGAQTLVPLVTAGLEQYEGPKGGAPQTLGGLDRVVAMTRRCNCGYFFVDE